MTVEILKQPERVQPRSPMVTGNDERSIASSLMSILEKETASSVLSYSSVRDRLLVSSDTGNTAAHVIARWEMRIWGSKNASSEIAKYGDLATCANSNGILVAEYLRDNEEINSVNTQLLNTLIPIVKRDASKIPQAQANVNVDMLSAFAIDELYIGASLPPKYLLYANKNVSSVLSIHDPAGWTVAHTFVRSIREGRVPRFDPERGEEILIQIANDKKLVVLTDDKGISVADMLNSCVSNPLVRRYLLNTLISVIKDQKKERITSAAEDAIRPA